MSTTIYDFPTTGSGSNQSIQLNYNFDNISIRPPTEITLINDQKLEHILTLFESFNVNYSSAIYYSFSIDTQTGEKQISYSDNITNSPIKYTIQYIHVGISPIKFDTTTANPDNCALIYDCFDFINNGILLIIIPIQKITSTAKETQNVKNLLARISNTDNNNLDINSFMPNSTFNTYSNGSNKVIIFNKESSIKYSSAGFLNTIKEANLVSSHVSSNNDALPLLSAYTSFTIPKKEIIVSQNDIYIDCYKVGESDKIDGGINIDTQTKDKKKSRAQKKENEQNAIGLYIFL